MAGVWKRKDRDVWVADYRDAAGIRRRVVASTREGAEQKLADRIRESRQATAAATEDRDITLERYVTRWLEAAQHEVAPKTLESYRNLLRLHVLPVMGRTRVRDITRRHVKNLLVEKRTQDYAKDTVRLIRAALSSVLTDAVDDGILIANPALSLGRKKRRRVDTITSADRAARIRPMTWEQRDRFLTAASGDPRYGVLFELLAKTGLRPGEAFALQPGDVDFAEGTLRVERARSMREIKSTKTYETRTVDLTPQLVKTLRRHVHAVQTEALRRGWGEPQWLFPSEAGQPLDQSRTRSSGGT